MNSPISSLTRREFLARSTLTAAALTLGVRGAEAPPPAGGRFPIIAFSKPFERLNAAQTADFVAEIGWDGIECPVRAKSPIEPERVAEQLPELVGALRRSQRDVHLVTTDITAVTQPHAETVLRTVAQLGVKRVRLGVWKYLPNQSPADRLKEIAPALRDIAAACRELGLQAGFQNHSGHDYVGAPVWDIYTLIRDLDPRAMGVCFDIGHATIEGGLSWPIEAKLMEPFYTAVFVKDFTWKKGPRGWREAWCNLGDGMVDRAFFDRLKASAYRGPISQHHEYELGDLKQMTAHMKQDLAVLKSWLA